MARTEPRQLTAFRLELEQEYAERFPRSRSYLAEAGRHVLDGCSHAVRWNEPFMPVVRRAEGATIEDLDGNELVDYWQGHFANLLGHNPPLIRETLARALEAGAGLQSGMLHEVEGDVARLICERTGLDTVRLTTSGTLGTFYAILLARAFTGRGRVLKVSGGWHGSQPFGLKGVSAHGRSFDHMESEGLPTAADAEITLTRFNDVDDLRRTFERSGDELACFVIEPMLGAAGGLVSDSEYLTEARRLTEKHGALLLCDEIITGFRFRAGDLSSVYGVRPDLLILGKILGGGMPVAAVAGRADVMELCTRRSGRVKFEGGTYSAQELSLVATRTMLRHLIDNEQEIYGLLARLGKTLRAGVERASRETGVPLFVLGRPDGVLPGSSTVYVHSAREGAAPPTCPEELAERGNPLIDERLFKSTLILEGVSGRTGLGGISTVHDDTHLQRTCDALTGALTRFKKAGLA